MVRFLRWGSLLLALAGCADLQYTSSYPAPPEAFAQHDAGHRFFDLHWTLGREKGRGVVQGIVTASRVDAIQDVTVEGSAGPVLAVVYWQAKRDNTGAEGEARGLKTLSQREDTP